MIKYKHYCDQCRKKSCFKHCFSSKNSFVLYSARANLASFYQVGVDSGRHEWFKWSRGPTPEGEKTTQAINLFDLALLSVDSGFATEEFHWREPKPCSNTITRLLGILDFEIDASHNSQLAKKSTHES